MKFCGFLDFCKFCDLSIVLESEAESCHFAFAKKKEEERNKIPLGLIFSCPSSSRPTLDIDCSAYSLCWIQSLPATQTKPQ